MAKFELQSGAEYRLSFGIKLKRSNNSGESDKQNANVQFICSM